MSNQTPRPPVQYWVSEALSPEIRSALERLQLADDVQYIAVMPDCHLAADVCNGCVLATTTLIYPDAVGGDIGCGMATVAFDCSADLLNDEKAAAAIMAGLYKSVPVNRQPRTVELPGELESATLSVPSLDARKRRDGRVQFGTLGRGNHFVELQRDDQDRLWLMVHSGSRAMGQAIREHHTAQERARSKLPALDSSSPAGQAYLADAQWAVDYARLSRRRIIDRAIELMRRELGVYALDDSYTDCCHNHVRLETHFGRPLWVHRKGANSAAQSERGLIPGSMGTESYHVEGRGDQAALCSSSHGAGRAMSRDQARRHISAHRFQRAMANVWYDQRKTPALREESPEAYKNIRAVMRAQRDLVRIIRVLHPVLSYKGV